MLREAKINRIKVCEAFESNYFFKPHEESDNIYLNAADLKALEEFDLSGNTRLERACDLFLPGNYTGLRFSDYSRLTSEHIQDNLITIQQTKTGGRVVIPEKQLLKLRKRAALPSCRKHQIR
ncbi:hypothetical protein CLV59_111170 [Chitinophaga dinghuensis]|uniref:Uncharacterized protein n=1 Tax=Chitinophaga dinghuensis TaxID=1539050 RepID=A0A327VME1_9BACT|nr:hypothetical protein [Chitinophaga dinghuensis]RAJ74050.1 hypothetical protein CLV59_111170 [Chitinophaga dinghuensis]